MAFDFPNSPALNDQFTPAGGPTWVWNGSVWLQAPSQLSVVPQGQCQLDIVGGTMTLYPLNGNLLWINGVNRQLPSAGVTLAPTGVLAGSVAIYAYWTGSAIALEAISSPGTVLDAASGMRVKPGDPTRTFVGMHYMLTNGVWTTSYVATSSWFNPRPKTANSGTPVNPSTASTGYIELATQLRMNFALCTGRWAYFNLDATTYSSLATADTYTGIGLDGTSGVLPGVRTARLAAVGGSAQYPLHIGGFTAPSEGGHFITPIGAVSAGSTGTWVGAWTDLTIFG